MIVEIPEQFDATLESGARAEIEPRVRTSGTTPARTNRCLLQGRRGPRGGRYQGRDLQEEAGGGVDPPALLDAVRGGQRRRRGGASSRAQVGMSLAELSGLHDGDHVADGRVVPGDRLGAGEERGTMGTLLIGPAARGEDGHGQVLDRVRDFAW